MAGSLVVNTVLFARAHGLDEAAIEAATGLPMAELVITDARFDEDLVARLWRALCARHPGQALPLRMAAAAPPSYLGPLAYGARFVPDLRRGIETFVRYRALLSTALHTALVEEGERAAIVVDHPSDEIDAGAGAEVGLAMGRRFFDEILGMAEVLVAVEFRHQPRAPVSEYEAFFGVPAHFGAPRTALCLARDTLAREPPGCDPALWRYIEARLRLATESLVGDDGLGEVRRAIADNAARREYGAEALAGALAMSLRALQRQVAAAGTTLRKLLEEARCAQAKQLLGDRSLSVEEVAFILDYSDERAFRRAFKRMTGASPAQYRRRPREPT
ncbi:MAG: AraC family transcriptional regulator ligand-binding domain-containing protein [Myxococcales bacterium]|nr:AraC family transcriptional regulator ligand-binding domain-containing protein [Myxococcales bacterium]